MAKDSFGVLGVNPKPLNPLNPKPQTRNLKPEALSRNRKKALNLKP